MCRRIRLCSLSLLLAAAVLLSAADKPIITVLDFQIDQVSENEMKTLISLLSSALFRTGRYTVIDVSERDQLLKEVEFSQGDCTDESCQLEIGKLLAAEYIVVGRLGKIGKKYVVSVKALETASSRTVSTADGVYDELEAVLDDLSSIASKLAGAEPAVEAPEEEVAAAPAEPTGERPPIVEPVKEEAPAKPRVRLSGKRIAALGCLSAAIVSGGIGAALLVGAVQYLRGPVTTAYDAYMAEPQGSTAFDTLYEAYAAAFGTYKGKLAPTMALLGGAVVLGGASVVLFVLPEKKTVTAALTVEPAVSGAAVRLWLGW